MANPILEKLGQRSQAISSNSNAKGIMLQAFAAMMSGQTPQVFLQNLAKNYSEMQGLDFSNPNATAEQLYAAKGQDINQAKSSIKDQLFGLINL